MDHLPALLLAHGFFVELEIFFLDWPLDEGTMLALVVYGEWIGDAEKLLRWLGALRDSSSERLIRSNFLVELDSRLHVNCI